MLPTIYQNRLELTTVSQINNEIFTNDERPVKSIAGSQNLCFVLQFNIFIFCCALFHLILKNQELSALQVIASVVNKGPIITYVIIVTAAFLLRFYSRCVLFYCYH